MFPESLILDHDEWVAAARDAAASVSPADIEDAFIASLAVERLDLRSALGSLAVAQHLPEHSFTRQTDSDQCGFCGLPERSQEELNSLSFERFKWGGVRRDSISFVAFDLEQFSRAPREVPNKKAFAAGVALISALRKAPADATPSQMAGRLKMIKGTSAEREVLLDILGVCGILRTAEHGGYATEFVPAAQRVLPAQRYVDRAYPLCWWKGRDGVDEYALKTFLPKLA